MTRPRARVLVAVLFTAATLAGASVARGVDEAPPCTPRMLVLSAFPAELDLLITQATDRGPTTVVDNRRFYVGKLAGNDVILALTGIGILNAEEVARAAYATFGCGDGSGITGVVFSGVAGGPRIGDVTVPKRWTLDAKKWFRSDVRMMRVATRVAKRGDAKLTRDVPVGDPCCVGVDPHLLQPFQLPHQPEVLIGGDGISSDPFNGRKLPCAPNGGDTFGCEPCREQSGDPPDMARFLTEAAPFVDPNFIAGYFEAPPAIDQRYVAQDMETAAVAKVAAEHKTPFIAFRAVSDGEGDPLMLPGFPFQFFAYRHIAADNAGLMTMAFLAEWSK